jgi:hypothetical protein
MDSSQNKACLTNVLRQEDCVEVEFNCRVSFRLPYLFLRDSCTWSFDKRNGARVFTVANATAELLEAEDAGIARNSKYNGLVIIWKDGSESTFDATWLFQKCTANADSLSVGTSQRLWASDDMTGKISTYNFREIVVDDRTQLDLLETLVASGIALVRDTPCRLSALQRDIAQRIFGSSALAKPFSYKLDSQSKGEDLHTRAIHSELSYCDDSPGIMAVLCTKLRATRQVDEDAPCNEADSGGEFLLVDGLSLFETLQSQFPAELGTFVFVVLELAYAIRVRTHAVGPS